MVAIPLDKINYNKVYKYTNVLIFKEFYPQTKNVSYYLNRGLCCRYNSHTEIYYGILIKFTNVWDEMIIKIKI